MRGFVSVEEESKNEEDVSFLFTVADTGIGISESNQQVIFDVFAQADGIGFWGAIALISLAASSHQAWSANIFTTVSDMFPKKLVASVTGIGGFAGSIGGMLVAIFAGNILEFWEGKGNIEVGYSTLFIISGSAYIVAWILFNLIAPKMKQVDL